MAFGNTNSVRKGNLQGVLSKGSLSNKFLSLLLSVLVACAMCPTMAFATTAQTDDESVLEAEQLESANAVITEKSNSAEIAQGEQFQTTYQSSGQEAIDSAESEIQLQTSPSNQQSGLSEGGEAISASTPLLCDGVPNAPAAPTFSANIGGKAIEAKNVTYQENGYSYTGFEYAPDDPNADGYGYIYPQYQCGLYTVAVPAGTSLVDFEFSYACLAYGYDDDKFTCTEGADEYGDGFVGKEAAARSVDKDGDGNMDFVQVQSPYDESWNSTIFYAITFVYEGGTSDTPVPGGSSGAMNQELNDIYATTGKMLASKADQLSVGSVGGEWAVLGLQRSSVASLSESEIASYYTAVAAEAKSSNNGKLSATKSTDNSRVVIALAALGKDPSDVEGVNLLTPLADMNYLVKQGVNGPIWALIAFDAADVKTIPVVADGGSQATREVLIDYILNARTADGGWALYGGIAADPDVTSMAITALAPYCDNDPNVKAVVDKALECLSNIQQADGGYASGGISNSGSCAQVVVALCTLGIDPVTDTRFVKNDISVMDALISFAVAGGGFKLSVPQTFADGMATEQALYALAAYDRFKSGNKCLFDMSDVEQKDIDIPEVPGGSASEGTNPGGGSSGSGGQNTSSNVTSGNDSGSTEDTRTASGTTRSLGNAGTAASSNGESATTENASATVSISEKGKTVSENVKPLSSLESEGGNQAFPWPMILVLGCIGTALIGVGAGYYLANRKKPEGSRPIK